MFPYRKILELHGDNVSLRSIAQIVQHSCQKVTEVIKTADRKGVSLPLGEEMTDKWLEEFLFPEIKQEASGRHLMNFEHVHNELARPNVTLTLLHDEYVREAKSVNKIPYAYRTFAEHYHEYSKKHKATMRIKRKPGEIMEVDWAGSTLFFTDPDTGEPVKVYVFVAILPCSQLFYVEGSLRMDLPSWIKLHRHAFEYYGGTPQILVPDNLKTGVTKHTRKEIILNQTYAEMADHYGTVIMPARVRAPQDKASVEASVKHVSTWIIQALRNVTFFSLTEVNEEIKKKLEQLNDRPFQNKIGSRRSAFLEEEKFALSPLPDTPYQLSEWRTSKVRKDYHISINSMFYSVPYELIGQSVDVRVSDSLIEVYYNHMRVASHITLYGKFGQFSTLKEHMPYNHQVYIEQTPEEAIKWATGVGEYTLQVIMSILDRYDKEKQAVDIIFNLKKLERKYSRYEIERACRIVCQSTNNPTVKSIYTLIQANRKEDEREATTLNTQKTDANHGFTRGAAYYGGRDQ